MNIAVLLLFTETILPIGAIFNPHGVLLGGYIYEIKKKRFRVEFKFCNINGVWGGRVDISSATWGTASPLMRMDVRYSSLETCMRSLWKSVVQRVSHSEPALLSFLEKEKDKWDSAKDKFSLLHISNGAV